MLKKIPNDVFFAFAEEELKTNGKVRLRVKGVSMYPLLRDGRDEVLIARFGGGELKKGDIALFRYRKGHILHSFVKKESGFYFMKGINVIGNGEKCRREDILGVVEKIFRECRKNAGGDGFREINPDSLKWKSAVSLRKLRCRLYRIAISVKRFCSPSRT